MSKPLYILILLFAAARVEAVLTTNYVRALSVGTGNNSGSDWNNPITNFTFAAGTWTDNRVYFISQKCDGPQGSSYGLIDAQGVQIIAATVAHHGAAVGWQDAYATNGPSEIRNFTVQADNVVVDGQVGAYGTNFPGYVPYQLRIHGTNMGDNLYMIGIGAGGGTFNTNVVIQNAEGQDDNIPLTNTIPWSVNYAFISIKGNRPWGSNYFHNLWIHDFAGVGFQWQGVGMVIDQCYLARNGNARIATGNATDHSEFLFATDNSEGSVIRRCIFEDWRNTGGLVWGNITNSLTLQDSIIRQTGYWKRVGQDPGDSDGFFDFLSTQTGPWLNVKIIGNTFLNCSYGSKIAVQSISTNLTIENNLFWNDTNDTSGALAIGPRTGSGTATVDYNWYGQSGPSPHRADGVSEAHEQDVAINQFINDALGDLRLTANTLPGDSTVGAQFGTDFYGNPRTTWTRGAIEFTNVIVPVIWGIQIK